MVVDKSLSFGMQNFFFVEKDETDVTYNYVGSMDKKGMILISRYDKNYDSGLYYVGKGVFATVFAGKDGYDYVTPNLLPELVL